MLDSHVQEAVEVVEEPKNSTLFLDHILCQPEMLKLGRVTKVKVLFLVLVLVFNFDLFKFLATILEKGLLVDMPQNRYMKYVSRVEMTVSQRTRSVQKLVLSGQIVG